MVKVLALLPRHLWVHCRTLGFLHQTDAVYVTMGLVNVVYIHLAILGLTPMVLPIIVRHVHILAFFFGFGYLRVPIKFFA